MRWIQVAVYLPFMRVHGYMSRTEPWNYSEETQRNFRLQIDLRNKLMPYILECSKKVSEENYTMMRPLVFDFPHDEEALRQQTEYMFGPSLLVCPVTEPGITKMRVYLPEYEEGWQLFDPFGADLSSVYLSAENGSNDKPVENVYGGGRYIDVPVSPFSIPVFIKADQKINIK